MRVCARVRDNHDDVSATYNDLPAENVTDDLEGLLHLLLRSEVEHGATNDLVPGVPAGTRYHTSPHQQQHTSTAALAQNNLPKRATLAGFPAWDCVGP
jgi:hypothetical protein